MTMHGFRVFEGVVPTTERDVARLAARAGAPSPPQGPGAALAVQRTAIAAPRKGRVRWRVALSVALPLCAACHRPRDSALES